jgi:hypothetical protein
MKLVRMPRQVTLAAAVLLALLGAIIAVITGTALMTSSNHTFDAWLGFAIGVIAVVTAVAVGLRTG